MIDYRYNCCVEFRNITAECWLSRRIPSLSSTMERFVIIDLSCPMSLKIKRLLPKHLQEIMFSLNNWKIRSKYVLKNSKCTCIFFKTINVIPWFTNYTKFMQIYSIFIIVCTGEYSFSFFEVVAFSINWWRIHLILFINVLIFTFLTVYLIFQK